MSAPKKRPKLPTVSRWGSRSWYSFTPRLRARTNGRHLMEMIMKLGSHMSSWTWGPRHTQCVHCMNFLTKGTAIHWRMASSGLGSNINARMDSKHFKTVSAGFQDSFKISKPQWCRHVKHPRRQKRWDVFWTSHQERMISCKQYVLS